MSNSFNVIPAIDLLDGRVVRLLRGEYDKSTVYEVEPEAMLDEFASAGARLVHIVDLNAARSGSRDVNLSIIKRIVKAAETSGLKLELGGGIRTADSFRECLELGFQRGIIGTAAVKNPELVGELLANHPAESVIVGVDAKDGEVRLAGWERSSGVSAIELIQKLEADGVTEIIYTDIDTDGAMTGPPLESLKTVLQGSSKPKIIASGGVSSIEDIESLLKLGEPRLSGAISGRAIYEKKLDLAAAVRLCDLHSGSV